MQYGEEVSDISQTIHVMEGATTEAIITGLEAATTYCIKVAAMNSAGTGVYSNGVNVVTKGIVFETTCLLLHYRLSNLGHVFF